MVAIGVEVFTDSAKRPRDQQVQALRREGASGEHGQGLPVDRECHQKRPTLESMATGAKGWGIEGESDEEV